MWNAGTREDKLGLAAAVADKSNGMCLREQERESGNETKRDHPDDLYLVIEIPNACERNGQAD